MSRERLGAEPGDGQRQAYELRWPVWELEIVSRLLRRLPKVSGGPRTNRELEAWPPEGVFLPRGYIQKPRLLLPVREYEPVPLADEILTHVTRLNTSNTKAVLEFVNTWGPLGLSGDSDVYARLGIYPERVGEGFQAEHDRIFYDWTVNPLIPPAERVYWTRLALERIKSMASQLYELQRGTRWRERHTSPKSVDYGWVNLVDDLNGMIGGIRRAVRVKKGGGLYVVEGPTRLLQVLGLALLDRALSVTRQRRCPECGSYFVPKRSNQSFCQREGQQYCARKRALRTWRRRQRRRKR